MRAAMVANPQTLLRTAHAYLSDDLVDLSVIYEPDINICVINREIDTSIETIVYIAGYDRKVIYQGIHMLLGDSIGVPWAVDETRQSVLVFIGRNLPKQEIHAALNSCRVI
jgi:hypothetical protein